MTLSRVSLIFKYPFPVADQFVIQMPTHAEILTVQVQHGVPCIWARVDPSDPVSPRTFRVFGTGHPLPDDGRDGCYVGTFQMVDGDFVGHLYVEDGPSDDSQ